MGVCTVHAGHCGVLPRDRFQDFRWTDQIPPSVVPIQGKPIVMSTVVGSYYTLVVVLLVKEFV